MQLLEPTPHSKSRVVKTKKHSVRCPSCGGDGYVADSREIGDVRRRRRVCKPCGVQWYTLEGGEEVRKDPRKVQLALLADLEEHITGLVAEVTAKVLRQMKHKVKSGLVLK